MPHRYAPALLLSVGLALTACSTAPKSDASYERSMQLAADLEKRGDPATAAAFYQRATQQPEAGPQTWLKLGDSLLAGNDARGAERAFQRALELGPGNAEALLGLGTAQLRQGKLERAATALAQAAEGSDRAVAWNRLGIAQILRGQTTPAQSAFSHSLGLAPDDLDTRCNLALAYALGGERQKAVQTIEPVARSPLAQARHQRNELLVLVLAGDEQQLAGRSLDDIPAAERQQLLTEARRIKSLADPAQQARELGLVSQR
ncbi:tetratricopeptide repeat protein [Pseudomonas sp. JDS28PS106]|uniref:tetratricopeptide repeat protein n=1 Tax=Pseudomonas sp. JDS28PS106 TaxID=2497235 RepID=UPI002FD5A29E